MPDLRLRRYEPRDGDRVLELEREALESVDARPDDDDWTDDLRAIRETYLDSAGEFLVGEVGVGDAETEAELVAMGGLKRVDASTAEVTRMRVDPGHHRRGFGEAVLLELEERATDLGYEVLELETTARQRAAQSLYEKHGYERVGRRSQGRFEVLAYRKRLG
ncbi:GNAT family N-acetyltransferase [Halorussus salilacus]|uniref:GNAT family N-acetyltransferase n=1 Tax=Halorussus salilacus TaxID=2953750 RepID=UPI0020A1A99F|nr:GNAT family N-acetyltransferase [Halorussus salilacus]USZ67015.1 GNAT family N-acetyltransferase [Halorussus salilacus]